MQIKDNFLISMRRISILSIGVLLFFVTGCQDTSLITPEQISSKNFYSETIRDAKPINDLCALMNTIELEKITKMTVKRSTPDQISNIADSCVVIFDRGSLTLTNDFREFADMIEIAGQYESLGGQKLSMENNIGVGDMSALRFLGRIPSELYFSKNGKTFELSGGSVKRPLEKDELIQIAQMIVKNLSVGN